MLLATPRATPREQPMPLESSTRARIDAYWTAFFGGRPGLLSEPGTAVLPHAALAGYRGVWFFRRGDTLVISIPPDIAAPPLATLTAADFEDVERITSLLHTPVARVVGPAWIGYADATTLRPCHDSRARLLTDADSAAIDALRSACPAEAWEHGGSDIGDWPLAGVFDGDTLVALAGCERWGSDIAHLAVITHPAYRGRGLGTGAASLAAATALGHGLIPQYRTLRGNTPSLAIGARLGFVHYAESIAARLTAVA
jgi:GNAT superfamily N-acetyltransferase